MTEHENDPTPSAPQPPYGPPPTTGQPYGQPYGQYQPQQYAQPAQYPTQQYPAQQYGQAQYGQPGPYGQPAYGQYGEVAVPAKPAQVIVPAVLGFIYGALGVLVSLLFVIGGVAATNAGNSADSSIPGIGRLAGAVGGLVIGIGVLALIWTVLMIWGSVSALRGRSRVLLIVGGSISIATTGIGLLGSLGSMNDPTTNNGPLAVLLSLAFFLGALAIVILLSMRPAGQFYAAHRARRGR
jgi:hypothetical protein